MLLNNYEKMLANPALYIANNRCTKFPIHCHAGYRLSLIITQYYCIIYKAQSMVLTF